MKMINFDYMPGVKGSSGADITQLINNPIDFYKRVTENPKILISGDLSRVIEEIKFLEDFGVSNAGIYYAFKRCGINLEKLFGFRFNE